MENDQLKKIHELEIVMAEEIKRICQKYEIKYFLLAGSTLGAVRHGGFIPWDDDMDVGMLREDYEKFLKVCKTELGQQYFLQTWDTDPEFPYSFAKIRLKGTHMVVRFSAKSNMNNGIFVDIFPFDSVPDVVVARKLQGAECFMCRRLLWIKKGLGKSTKNTVLDTIKYNLFFAFSHLFGYESLIKHFKKIQVRYNGKNTKKIVTDGSYGYSKESIERSWTDELVMAKFENTEFPIFKKYKEYLTYLYGDYMKLPPENERGGHLRVEIDFGPYAD